MNRYLAGLGAFITIAALAIDPFSQAIINHKSCEITADFGLAQVSRTNNYSGNPPQLYSPYGAMLIALNQQMRRAIYRGLVDPPKAGELADFTCTSGNCTFERDGGGSYFSSLGMCSLCNDITEKVVNASEQGPTGSMVTTFHLPWSANITNERLFSVRGSSRIFTMRPTPIRAYQNSTPPIYSFDILSQARSKCDTCRPVFAAQCRIDPCVKRFSASVSNGAYTEKEDGDALILRRRPTAFNDYGTEETASSFGLLTESVLIDGTERKCRELDDEADNSVKVGFKDGAFQEVYDKYNDADKQNLTWKYFPTECVWVVERSSWFGMRQMMAELLRGDITTLGSDSAGYDWANGSFWNKELFAGGNISMITVNNLVTGLASSMTTTMRNAPYGASEELASNVSADLKMTSGRVMTTETCIYVEWGWIAYPSALLGLQWIFSILVLHACSRRARSSPGLSRAVWKSSPLALLFHGLDDDLRAKSINIETVKQMESSADDVRVRLLPVKDSQRNGWKFADM